MGKHVASSLSVMGCLLLLGCGSGGPTIVITSPDQLGEWKANARTVEANQWKLSSWLDGTAYDPGAFTTVTLQLKHPTLQPLPDSISSTVQLTLTNASTKALVREFSGNLDFRQRTQRPGELKLVLPDPFRSDARKPDSKRLPEADYLLGIDVFLEDGTALKIDGVPIKVFKLSRAR